MKRSRKGERDKEKVKYSGHRVHFRQGHDTKAALDIGLNFFREHFTSIGKNCLFFLQLRFFSTQVYQTLDWI